MTDQWFLDLDGVRSGPYQTNEVMGLIADGEVFPHHRISTSLKDSNWQTILDWRLEQARQSQSKRVSPQQPLSPEPPSSEKPIPSPQNPPPSPEPVAPPKSQIVESPDDSLPPPLVTFAPSQEEFLKEIESMEREMAETSTSGSKRDPMAEMFDILQNTRQKREAKQLQSAQQASEEEKLNAKKPLSVTRLVAICILVSLLGLALGQWYQLANTPAPTAAKNEKGETQSDSALPPKTEVVDRSTEKMTIRAVVDKKPEPTPTKPVTVKTRSAPTAPPAPVLPSSEEPAEEPLAEKKTVDKDLEELRDLKKELQELKALKEELKNAPLSDEFNEGDLGPYPDNAGGSFGGTNGGAAYPPPPMDGSGGPAADRPKSSPSQEDIQY